MFWNDPTFYGATFPYRDIAPTFRPPFMETAYAPWMNPPKFVPPNLGFVPPAYGFVPPPYGFVPPTYGFVPPTQQINPYLHYNLNLPLFGAYKPFTF